MLHCWFSLLPFSQWAGEIHEASRDYHPELHVFIIATTSVLFLLMGKVINFLPSEVHGSAWCTTDLTSPNCSWNMAESSIWSYLVPALQMFFATGLWFLCFVLPKQRWSCPHFTNLTEPRNSMECVMDSCCCVVGRSCWGGTGCTGSS